MPEVQPIENGRLVVGRVRMLFDELQLTPILSLYYESTANPTQACIVGALLLKQGIPADEILDVVAGIGDFANSDFGITFPYLKGLSAGWSFPAYESFIDPYQNADGENTSDIEEYRHGFADGWKARVSVCFNIPMRERPSAGWPSRKELPLELQELI